MKIKFVLLFLFISFNVLAQGVDNLWLMGYESWGGRPFGGVNIDFKSGSLDTSYQSRKMNFGETNGEICDKNGNFLFSSNGAWIANALNDTMLNGAGLNPSFYTFENDSSGLYITQGNLIIPFPSDSNKYYLFHLTVDDQTTDCSLYLYYSIIDMSGDSGRGTVIQKNNILLNDSLISGGLTACKHANGRDWWIIAHQFRIGSTIFALNSSSLYYKFLLTAAGIQEPDTQTIGSEISGGQCVFSPDGKYFAYYDPDTDTLDVYDFDRCSGNFIPKLQMDINDTPLADGAAFSPNSQVLYISTGYYVYQFDMNASNIAASKTTVLIADSTSSGFYLSQLAPDGKIYIIGAGVTQTMHVINNPDVLGLGCNACQDCVILPALNAWTIANHPNYFLGAENGSVCDSLTGLTPSPSPKERGAIRLFPDPVVDGEVTFTYAVSGEAGVISIYDAEGKEVAHYPLPQWSSVQRMKLPELSSGIYLARLVRGGYSGGVKFVKE